MTRISASVLFTPFSKLYILTELSANDVKFISSVGQELDLSKYIYSYGTVNSIFVEIQPDSTNIKNDPRTQLENSTRRALFDKNTKLSSQHVINPLYTA